MDLGLEGSRALVAASSRGLGRAVARELAAEGARVVITSRSKGTLEEAAAGIAGETGGQVRWVAADLRRAEDVRRLVAEAAGRLGGLDVLVTNSGGPPAGDFEDFGDEAWREAFELNLLSVVRLVREALPHLRASRSGRILNIASSSIKQPIEGLVLSNTFRAGVAGLAKSLAAELAPEGILVNTIGPGRISTDRVRQLDEARAKELGITPEEAKARSEAGIPLGRYGTPEELARLATFLVSPANSYVTGQAVLVDGGMVRAL